MLKLWSLLQLIVLQNLMKQYFDVFLKHLKLEFQTKGRRLKYWKCERVEENIDFDHIAYLCEGYTGSDLFDLCKKAAYFPIRELLDEEKKGRSFSVSDSSLSSFSFTYLNIFIFVTLGTMISRAEMSGMHIHI